VTFTLVVEVGDLGGGGKGEGRGGGGGGGGVGGETDRRGVS
jgi:hypothetical protein